MAIQSINKFEELLIKILEKVKTKKYSSTLIINMIKKLFSACEKEYYYNSKINAILEEIIFYDHQGFLKNIYELVKNSPEIEKINFFRGFINKLNIKNVTLGHWDRSFWDEFKFCNCNLSNVEIDSPLSYFTSLNPIKTLSSDNNFKNISFKQINYESWREIKIGRVPYSSFTFRTNLYLELARVCNANCSFCRNNSFQSTPYNYKEIAKSLKFIHSYIDNIIIGGGEPTLLMSDLLKLKGLISKIDPYIKSYVFTNGSASLEDYQKLMSIYWGRSFSLSDTFGIYVSRHAIDNEKNAEIFNYANPKDMDTKKLMEIAKSSKNVLSATCVKNGLDTSDKILEYIKWGINVLKFSNILISNLHEDFSMGSNSFTDTNEKINNRTFADTFFKLNYMGFKQKPIIYATGGYTMTIFEKNNIRIIFKQYIPKIELDNHFKNADKRTFDLSMAPDGQLYENWHQQSGAIERKLIKCSTRN